MYIDRRFDPYKGKSENELRNMIAMTDYSMNYKEVVSEMTYKVDSESETEIVVKTPRVETSEFVKISDRLLSIINNDFKKGDNNCIIDDRINGDDEAKDIHLDPYCHTLLFFILNRIEYYSNTITFKINDAVNSTGICKNSVINSINKLHKKGIITKTNSQSLYVINHNLMFKGDIIKFVRQYNKLYEGKYAKKDDNGRIIINK